MICFWQQRHQTPAHTFVISPVLNISLFPLGFFLLQNNLSFLSLSRSVHTSLQCVFSRVAEEQRFTLLSTEARQAWGTAPGEFLAEPALALPAHKGFAFKIVRNGSFKKNNKKVLCIVIDGCCTTVKDRCAGISLEETASGIKTQDLPSTSRCCMCWQVLSWCHGHHSP